MTHQHGRVVTEILNRYFGEIVQKVGDDLFTYGARPISMIAKSSGVSRGKVIESLRTLLKFDLVTFEPSKIEIYADYKLVAENVLLLIRYPRYLLLIKKKYGSEAELIVEELLQNGVNTATNLLVSIAKRFKNDKEKNITIVSLKDMFISLATAGYIQQAPVAEIKEESEVPTLVPVATVVPELDARILVLAMNEGTKDIQDNIYWKVHFDRFHHDIRDDIMVKAMTRRVDENAGELMRHILVQMYVNSSPWAATSNPVPLVELKVSCRRATTEHPLLMQYFEHYLKVLEESGAGFISRSGDASGGQYSVRLQKAAQECVCSILDHLVNEKLGSHAARIFRLIRAKKYIEEEEIQKHAMLPNKECKELTYKLLENHFISVQPMKKAPTAGGGLVKAIYLYHINFHEVTHTALELSLRSLQHILRRAAHARSSHARLLDKRRRVRSIVHGMRLRSEPQQNIDDVEETITPPERQLLANVEKTMKQLSTAELELDNTLFILNWHYMYKKQ